MSQKKANLRPVFAIVVLVLLLGRLVLLRAAGSAASSVADPHGSAVPEVVLIVAPQPNATLPTSTLTSTSVPSPTSTSTATNTPTPTASHTATATPDLRDAYEPDDVDPRPIADGETQVHNFYPDGDVDKIRFVAVAGRYYRVFTSDLATGVDTTMTMTLLVDGTTLPSNDSHAGGLGSELVFSNTTGLDSLAVVEVHNRWTYGAGATYRLTMQQLSDQYEPDDTAPKPIALPETQAHSFYPVNDVDKVAFLAKAGRSYRVSTSGLAVGVDTMLKVTVGGLIYTNDDRQPSDYSSLVIFQAGASDVQAVVEVTNLGQFGASAGYQLTAAEIIPTPTSTSTHTLTPSPTTSSTVTQTPTFTPTPSPTGIPTVTQTPDLRDAYEPDDVTPKPIIAGAPQTHNFYPAGDVDKVTFLAKAGRYYRLSTSGLAAGVDTTLTVVVGTMTYSNDDRQPGDLSSALTLFVSGANDINAVATVANRGLDGPDKVYQLTLEEIIPTATPTRTNTPVGTATATPTLDLRDAYEPDEVTPAELILGLSQARSFYPAGDVDRSRFLAKAWRTYRVSTSQLASGVDTFLTVQMGGAAYINDDRSIGDLSSLIAFTNGTSGDVQVLITVTNLGLFGADKTYQLLAEEILPTGTPLPTATPTHTPTSTPVPWDAYEPDDLVPGSIVLGQPQLHTFSPEGDVDKVQFRALAGHSYRVFVSDEASGVDAYLIPMVSEILAPSADGGSARTTMDSSEVIIQIGPDRDADVMIEARNRGRYGVDMSYRITAAEILFTRTPTPTSTPMPTRSTTPMPTSTAVPSATPGSPAASLPAWRRAALAGRTVRDLSIHTGHADHVMVSVAGSDLGIFLTTDGGITWRTATTGLPDLNLYRLVREPTAPWMVYATSVDRLWMSADEGLNWNPVNLGASFSGTAGLAAAPTLAGRVYLATWGPCALFASSGGAWATNSFANPCGDEPLDSAIEVSSLRPNTLYMARAPDRPEIYHSEDAGTHWQRLTDIAGGVGINDLALDALDDRHLYAATAGAGVYVSLDGGATWGPMNNGLPAGGLGADVTALSLDLADAGVIYAAVRGAGIYRAALTTQWWEPYGSFPGEARVYALRASLLRRERLWAATNDGVWVMESARRWLPLLLKSACWQGPCATPTPTATPAPPTTPTSRPYPYPWPTTPTAGPSSTPTLGATATPSLTPTPSITATHSPTPRGCSEWVGNGGFETDSVWRLGNTPRRATYTTAVRHSGARSMRLGIEPSSSNTESYSSAYQIITIPYSATSATLRFWWQRRTEETPSGEVRSPEALGERPALEEAPPRRGLETAPTSYADVQEVLLLDGTYFTTVAVLDQTLSNDGAWVEAAYDLMDWRGRKLALYFNAYNNGFGGRTWMYLDDVSLQVCVPASVGE